jgi:hypothetical protein
MSDLKPGETVDITIKGALIHEISSNGVVMALHADGHDFELPVDAAKDWCEAVAPEMQHGDVWRDRDGDLWLVQYGPEDGDDLRMYSAAGPETPASAQLAYGPLTLVRREARS